MKKAAQSDAGMQKLADLIAQAPIAMLTTEEPDGSLRSRPLATLQMDSEGKLWFFTALSSGKVGEIDQHRKVNLSYANTDKQSYVSVCGSARLFRDRDKMRELWTPWVEPWFPDGLADPDLALLEITTQSTGMPRPAEPGGSSGSRRPLRAAAPSRWVSTAVFIPPTPPRPHKPRSRQAAVCAQSMRTASCHGAGRQQRHDFRVLVGSIAQPNGRLTAAEVLGHRDFVMTKLYRSA